MCANISLGLISLHQAFEAIKILYIMFNPLHLECLTIYPYYIKSFSYSNQGICNRCYHFQCNLLFCGCALYSGILHYHDFTRYQHKLNQVWFMFEFSTELIDFLRCHVTNQGDSQRDDFIYTGELMLSE